jgi:hypothetical protein
MRVSLGTYNGNANEVCGNATTAMPMKECINNIAFLLYDKSKQLTNFSIISVLKNGYSV